MILPSRNLHTPTNLILLSLAVSDLLVGLAGMPIAIVFLQSCWHLDEILCVASYLMTFILTSASIGNMVLISVDRYVAICHPLYYPSAVTSGRAKICVSVCWIWSVIYNIAILKDHLLQVNWSNSCHQECIVVINYTLGAVDLVLTFFSPVTVIIVLYMRVFVAAFSQARALRSHISANKSNTVTVTKSALKAIRTLGIVLFVFLLCICPYFCPFIAGQNLTGADFLAQIWLVYCNSTFNPIIYAFFYPWFRKAIKITVSLHIVQSGSSQLILM